jgi:hypothetical protein
LEKERVMDTRTADTWSPGLRSLFAILRTAGWGATGVLLFGVMARWVFPLSNSLFLASSRGDALDTGVYVLVSLGIGAAVAGSVFWRRIPATPFVVAAVLVLATYGPLMIGALPDPWWVHGSRIWLEGYGVLPFFVAGLFAAAAGHRVWLRHASRPS